MCNKYNKVKLLDRDDVCSSFNVISHNTWTIRYIFNQNQSCIGEDITASMWLISSSNVKKNLCITNRKK